MESFYGEADRVFANEYLHHAEVALGESWSSTASDSEESSGTWPNFLEQIDDANPLTAYQDTPMSGQTWAWC